MNTHIEINTVDASASTINKKLPTLLRGFGAAAVAISLYSFLFQGWEGGNDLIRYLMLLAHSGLLTVIALLASHYLKEGKSPRVLLMLALASVPVNFAILGAFVLSASVDTQLSNYPDYLTWTVGNWSTLLPLLASALIVLLPVMFIGFQALVRGMSKTMIGLFMLSNLVLLIPVRDPVLISIFATLFGCMTLLISSKTARQRTEAKTFEGAIALVLQFVPLAILLVRNLWVYQIDAFVTMGLSVIVFIALSHATRLLETKSFWRHSLEALSALIALLAGVSFAAALEDSVLALPISLLATLGSFLTFGLLYNLSSRAAKGKTFYRVLSAGSLVAVQILSLFAQIDGFSSELCLLTGAVLTLLGVYRQRGVLLLSGSLLLATSIFYQLVIALQFFDLNFWITLTIAGVLAIVAASIMESKTVALKNYFFKTKDRLKEWEA